MKPWGSRERGWRQIELEEVGAGWGPKQSDPALIKNTAVTKGETKMETIIGQQVFPLWFNNRTCCAFIIKLLFHCIIVSEQECSQNPKSISIKFQLIMYYLQHRNKLLQLFVSVLPISLLCCFSCGILSSLLN